MMGKMVVVVPPALRAAREDVLTALDLVANAPTIFQRLLSEMPTPPRRPTTTVRKQLWVQTWVALNQPPVIPAGERLSFRTDAYTRLLPRYFLVLANPTTARACEVHVADKVYSVAFSEHSLDDKSARYLADLDCWDALTLVVENVGAAPSIVRPVLIADDIGIPLPDRLFQADVRDIDPDVQSVFRSVHPQTPTPIGMRAGHLHHRFTVAAEDPRAMPILWRTFWPCKPHAFRIHTQEPDDIVLTSIQRRAEIVFDGLEPITGDWQTPGRLADVQLSAGASLCFGLHTRSGLQRDVRIELLVDAEVES